MKITKSTVLQIEITDVQGLDPIRVILSDIGPGQGRINIECYGQSWANYWGGMGNETIAEFFTTCDENYLAGKLRGELQPEVFDPDHLKNKLKADLIDERRKHFISSREARRKFNEIEELDLPETEEQLWSIAPTMHLIIGDEWWYSIPKKPNPDYQYLCRVIKTVQEALRYRSCQ